MSLLSVIIGLDASLVRLPVRRRIENPAFAVFARGKDPGNGLIGYSVLAISAGLLVFTEIVIGVLQILKGQCITNIDDRDSTTIIHFTGIAKAAPIMLSR